MGDGQNRKLGIIGVGHLAHSMLRGCLRGGWLPGDILLSPRGQGRGLAQAHGFGLATGNAEIVDRCDMVLLAVRPAHVGPALDDLSWRSGQLLVSACAGVPVAALARLAKGAEVIRIMPITASELGASPTLVYPAHPGVAPLLEAIGSTIALQSENEFEAATVSAAIYGWAQALIREGAQWSAAAGLDDKTARELVARTFVAAGRMISETDAPMDDILSSIATPGGITEAGLTHLDQAGVPDAWRGACDVVLSRLVAKG